MREVSVKAAAAVMRAAKDEGANLAEIEQDVETQVRRGMHASSWSIQCLIEAQGMWLPKYKPIKLREAKLERAEAKRVT